VDDIPGESKTDCAKDDTARGTNVYQPDARTTIPD
jgi:hypothetical protein